MMEKPEQKPEARPETIRFYDEHADDFYERTYNLDVRELAKPFLDRLTAGAHLLDAGCGSGRDSLYFKNQGFSIVAMDASREMVSRASLLLDQPVLLMTFQEMDFSEDFDGVWACASLLHVPRREMSEVMDRLTRALKPGGILYTSFKLGTEEIVRHERLFNDYDDLTFRSLLSAHPSLFIEELWTTKDLRPDHDRKWLNAIMRKIGKDA